MAFQRQGGVKIGKRFRGNRNPTFQAKTVPTIVQSEKTRAMFAQQQHHAVLRKLPVEHCAADRRHGADYGSLGWRAADPGCSATILREQVALHRTPASAVRQPFSSPTRRSPHRQGMAESGRFTGGAVARPLPSVCRPPRRHAIAPAGRSARFARHVEGNGITVTGSHPSMPRRHSRSLAGTPQAWAGASCQ